MANVTRWLFGYKTEQRLVNGSTVNVFVPNKCGHIFDCGAENFTNDQTVCPICGTSYAKSEGKQWTRSDS